MKTVRFSKIVAKCGAPVIHLTWLPLGKDPTLKAALAHNRVMTLHQTVRGSAKDYGTVGLMKTQHAQILIFPRSLRAFDDRRVIGIDYDLLTPSKKEREAVSTTPRQKSAEIAQDTDARETSARPTKGEVVSFHQGRREGASKKEKATPRAPAEASEKSAPPSWDDAAKELARACEDLRKRRLAAVRERLLRLENWIRRAQ